MKKSTFSIASIAIVSIAIIISAVVVFIGESNSGLDRKPSLGNSQIINSMGTNHKDFESLTTLYRTINLVQKHYLDATRIVPRKMLIEAMKELELDIAMLIANEKGDTLEVKIGDIKQSFPLNDLKTPWILLSRFKDIFTFIKENMKNEDVDFNELQYTAINGMLKALDPHTVLLTPDIYRSMKDRTHGNFGGLGIVISIRDGSLTIISPIDGTPAQRAGLKAGDVINKIDEASTINMPINDAVGLMRGKPGTSVKLQIQRKIWSEEKTFSIKRAIIKVRSVDSASMPNKIGYVRIHDFQANTAADLLEHLDSLSEKGPLKGLILDLRSNPGGLLSAAINVSDIFLSKGVIVTTAGQKLSERKVQHAHNFGNEPNYPIVVLVNSGTASASEIVAGALKGHERAVIIGERTFGKGSVQVLNEFEDSSALKLTTAQYLTPGDVSIQSVGISPHIELMQLRADKRVIQLRKSIRYREGDLNHHFENTGNTTKDTAAAIIKYLHTPELKEITDEKQTDEVPLEGDEDITEQSTYNFKFEPDFEINIAKEIALELNSAHKIAFSKESLTTVFSRIQKQEEQKLTQALRKLGIDWSKNASDTSHQIDAVATIVDADNLIAGQDNKFEVTITNTGSAPIYQLLGTTRSDFPPLNLKELAFGKMAPGERITRTLDFKIPKSYSTRTDDVKIIFEDANMQLLGKTATRITVNSLPNPVFAFNTLFLDSPNGNGDGLLQPGEVIQLVASIKNTGKGKALSVYANLTNESGNNIFLKKGRQKLEELQPGESKTATFEFEVKKAFAKRDVKLKLTVMDVDLRVFTTQALTYPILPPLEVTTLESKIVETIRETRLLTSPTEGAVPLVLGKIPTGIRLPAVARANGHYRITTGEDQWAWVLAADTGKPSVQEASPFEITVNDPPKIHFDFDKLVVRSEKILLKGSATDESKVKDLYIFNNKDKVFFTSNKGNKLNFKTTIPLEFGTNYITIVAEETAELETRQTFVVRRDRKDGMPYISAIDIEGTPEPLGILPSSN